MTNDVSEMLLKDKYRLSILETVSSLGIPDCFVAAGFLRNMVWDHLHGFSTATPLNDVDVIYYDPSEKDINTRKIYEQKLNELMPQVTWQVRNQARMHMKHGDKPYASVVDAMSYWPEKETAVAVRLNQGELEWATAFGFERLFDLKVTYNPKRPWNVFEHRVRSKNWLDQWPKLDIVCAD